MVNNSETIYKYKIIPKSYYSEGVDIKRYPSEMSWIHCCEFSQIPYVLEKFYPDKEVEILALNLTELYKSGFTVVYQSMSPQSGNQIFPTIIPPENDSKKKIPYNCVSYTMIADNFRNNPSFISKVKSLFHIN